MPNEQREDVMYSKCNSLPDTANILLDPTETLQSPIKALPDLTNTLTQLTKTSIHVDEFSNFMRTHDRQFFEQQFKKIPTRSDMSISIGKKPRNKAKNVSNNICPYNHARVQLTVDPVKKQGEYINASYVQGYKADQKFIASQGPNVTALDDFVRMLWEQRIDKVVMLTKIMEEGKRICERYWPETGSVQFGEIRVRLDTIHTFADYTIRRLQLIKDSHPARSLTQFHFTSWPDQGVPAFPWPFVDFERRVASHPTSRPIVVHCGDGVGPTGIFIALMNVMREAEETGTMDFYTTLWKLRQDRVYMIQTVEQYIFLHQATHAAMICVGTTVTIDNIQSRIDILNSIIEPTKETNLDKEFKAVCEMCGDGDGVKDSQSSSEDTSNPYMNSHMFKELSTSHLSRDSGDLEYHVKAVLTPGFARQNQQILTHLPRPTTVMNFWQMVTEHKVSLVVALQNDVEGLTLSKYLPDVKPTLEIGSFTIETQSSSKDEIFEKQHVCVTDGAEITPSLSGAPGHTEEHHLIHLKCSTTDLDTQKLLSIVNQIRSCRQNEGKIVYMCRNGADFSGLVCVLTLLLDRMDNDHCVTVPLVVGAIKAIRAQVIPTVEQYKILYDVLKNYENYSAYNALYEQGGSHTYSSFHVQGNADFKTITDHGNSGDIHSSDANLYANS